MAHNPYEDNSPLAGPASTFPSTQPTQDSQHVSFSSSNWSMDAAAASPTQPEEHDPASHEETYHESGSCSSALLEIGCVYRSLPKKDGPKLKETTSPKNEKIRNDTTTSSQAIDDVGNYITTSPTIQRVGNTSSTSPTTERAGNTTSTSPTIGRVGNRDSDTTDEDSSSKPVVETKTDTGRRLSKKRKFSETFPSCA